MLITGQFATSSAQTSDRLAVTPDLSRLGSLVDGPCPSCGWTRGTREVFHHRIETHRRTRLNGWCAQCGNFEVLWDGRS